MLATRIVELDFVKLASWSVAASITKDVSGILGGEAGGRNVCECDGKDPRGNRVLLWSFHCKHGPPNYTRTQLSSRRTPRVKAVFLPL